MQARLTRRRFLATTAAGAAAAWTLPGRTRAADSAGDLYGGFNLGIQSYTLRGFPVDKALEMIQELNLHSVEFINTHFSVDSTPEQIAAMKQKCESKGIKIMGHGVNGFGADKEANRKYFEFAKKAGIRNISADPSPEAFKNLDELVEEYDIRIAIHNHGPGARYDKVDDVLKAIQGHNPKIGACADLGHYIRSAEDPVEVIRKLEGRLFGIHLKDFDAQKANAKGVILGKGQLNVVDVFKALRKVNFPADGCLSLEYEEKANDPMGDVKECVAIAAEAARKSAG